MRIGVDIREFEKGKFTGIGRFLRNFLLYAGENDKENEYILIGNQKTDYLINFDNQKVIIIPEKITFLWDQFTLPNIIKKEKIDLFFSPYFKAPIFTKVRVITVIHDITPLVLQEYQTLKKMLERGYFKCMVKMLATKVEKILTVSNYSKKDIIEFFNIPEEKVVVVREAVSKNYYPLDSGFKEIVSKYGIKGEFIFYFGNFKPHKNVKTLIKSYQKLPDSIKNKYQLVLGGRFDHYKIELSDLISDLDFQCWNLCHAELLLSLQMYHPYLK